jgi:hypothetical protein
MTTSLRSKPASPPPTAAASSSGSSRWSVGFVLSRRLTSREQARLQRQSDPRLSAVCVALDDQATTFTVTAYGEIIEAVADVVPMVQTTLQDANLKRVSVRETWMVNHDEIEEDQPIRYYSVPEFAEALGISRQRVLQLASSGKLPAADARVGGKLLWLQKTIASFAAQRLIREGTDPVDA